MPETITLHGVLVFHSETGTEGGYWAFQDENYISRVIPRYGVFAHRTVWDASDPARKGKTLDDVEVQKEGLWIPLPDPMQSDPDYVLSSLFRGEPAGDREADARLMELYNFAITYAAERMDERFGEGNWHLEDDRTAIGPDGDRVHYGGTPPTVPQRPYGVAENEVTRSIVEWEDGVSEQRLSDSLLVESWSYEGLHVLGDGDELTIYDKDDPSLIVWSGTIRLEPHDLFTEDAFGMWIHADQAGSDRETWAKWFFERYPAKLTTSA